MLEQAALYEHTCSAGVRGTGSGPSRRPVRVLGSVVGAVLLAIAVGTRAASAAATTFAQQTNSSAEIIGKAASVTAVVTLVAAALLGGVLWHRRPRPKPPVYEDYLVDDFDDGNPGPLGHAHATAFEDLWREEATVPSPQRRWLE